MSRTQEAVCRKCIKRYSANEGVLKHCPSCGEKLVVLSANSYGIFGDKEYFVKHDGIYAAPEDECLDLNTRQRFGRFECSLAAWPNWAKRNLQIEVPHKEGKT